MYNPASIVDLRRNSNFSSSSARPSANLDPEASYQRSVRPAFQGFGNQYHGMPESPTPVSGVRMNESTLFHIPHSPIQHLDTRDSCKCVELFQRVSVLESRLADSEKRFVTFESEMLKMLRGISADLREAKFAGQTLSNETLARSYSVTPVTPPPLDLQSLHRPADKSTVFVNPHNSPTPELELTRDAIAGACVALERLVSDARHRSGIHSTYA